MDFPKNKTYIMGVLNVTPDSFSDGGKFLDIPQAVKHAIQMVAEGADILDVGGESSRPGSDPVSATEELRRVLPVIESLRSHVSVPISIDTYKPEVARQCLQAGASIINDISGLRNPQMIAIAAEYAATVIIMHMQGEPKSMQQNPVYTNVIAEIKNFFTERIAQARQSGVTSIILDPGIGFGKTLEHNLLIIKHLREFTKLGYPVLVGPSRKSFIGTLTGGLPPAERLAGTLAAVTISALHGAKIVRVHDVAACHRALQITDAINYTSKYSQT